MSVAAIVISSLRFKSPTSFPTDHSKEVPLLQFFVCVSAVSHVTFVCHYLFLISPSFGRGGRLCFVSIALPGYLHLHFIFVW